MYQSSNQYRLLQVFFNFPNRRFQLRELARETGIAYPSVRNHVNTLLGEGFVKKVREGVYAGFVLDDSERTRVYKRNDLLVRISDSGLLDVLERRCRPTCIVLYGSAVEGRDDERGDIDFFVQSREVDVDLHGYESEFMRKISILFEPDVGKLNKELVNSLANGVTLRGFLKVC